MHFTFCKASSTKNTDCFWQLPSIWPQYRSSNRQCANSEKCLLTHNCHTTWMHCLGILSVVNGKVAENYLGHISWGQVTTIRLREPIAKGHCSWLKADRQNIPRSTMVFIPDRKWRNIALWRCVTGKTLLPGINLLRCLVQIAGRYIFPFCCSPGCWYLRRSWDSSRNAYFCLYQASRRWGVIKETQTERLQTCSEDDCRLWLIVVSTTLLKSTQKPLEFFLKIPNNNEAKFVLSHF